jgi:hypothetical protein
MNPHFKHSPFSSKMKHLEIELSALMRADKELESAQDYTRGDTKLKPIRDAISARILELETALAEPSNRG